MQYLHPHCSCEYLSLCISIELAKTLKLARLWGFCGRSDDCLPAPERLSAATGSSTDGVLLSLRNERWRCFYETIRLNMVFFAILEM